MIKVLLLDVYNERVNVVEIDPDDLHGMYELLDCRCIDIVTRKVGGTWFDIVCDDEGLFHEPQKISALDGNGEPALVGNLIFAHHDNAGNLTGLTQEDLTCIAQNVIRIFTEQFPNGYCAICGVDWR